MSEQARDPAERPSGAAEEGESDARTKSPLPEVSVAWREVEAHLRSRGDARIAVHAARHPGFAYLLELLSDEGEESD